MSTSDGIVFDLDHSITHLYKTSIQSALHHLFSPQDGLVEVVMQEAFRECKMLNAALVDYVDLHMWTNDYLWYSITHENLVEYYYPRTCQLPKTPGLVSETWMQNLIIEHGLQAQSSLNIGATAAPEYLAPVQP